jgi:peptidoglycan-N-acetylglucosamine deacetylase
MKAITALLFLMLFSPAIFAKEVAITIDDAPFPRGPLFSGVEKTSRIIDALKTEKIQTAIFSNTIHFGTDGGLDRVKLYAKAGHSIGNHTSSHVNLEKVGAPKFLTTVDEAEQVLSRLEGFKKWFRFPFLREGRTKEERDAVRKGLSEKGYRNAYVTVDTYDYTIDDGLRKATKAKAKFDMEKACVFLGDLTIEGLTIHEGLAKKHLEKDVKHVLLMHENDVTASCLPKLLTTLKSKGWTIISPSAAYEDETLRAEPDTLWLNHGRVAAHAAALGKARFDSKWEDSRTVEKEMVRRGIIGASLR